MLRWGFPHEDHTMEPLLSKHTMEVALAALEPGTRKNYGAELLRYAQFCEDEGIPIHACLPASEAILAAFIATHAGMVSKSTVNTWISGLKYWHIVHGIPWEGRELLRATAAEAGKL